MMRRRGWRRFVPRRRRPLQATPIVSVSSDSVMEHVFMYLPSRPKPGVDTSALNGAIETVKQQVAQASEAEKSMLLEVLLVLQAPRTAHAQRQMDEHTGGYHNREKRLYELIDFNDTFVSCVLELEAEELPNFTDRIKDEMMTLCRRLHMPSFSDEQFEAIVRGLSREIAVYRGARAEGLEAAMTSRAQDAFGIDMVITDPQSGISLNLDCKTPSAFRYRLEELVKDGRISEQDLLQADEQDYCNIISCHNDEKIPVTILCIRPERLGEMEDFAFLQTAPLAALLREVMTK